jgi:carbonic anhydrase
MKKINTPSFAIICLTGILSLILSCTNPVSSIQPPSQDSLLISKSEIIDDEFLHKEIQDKLTPDLVLDILKKRNQDYMNDNLTVRNSSERIRKASLGQYPGAVVLSCLDSRVPVEDVFHCGIGDLFVARVAGNIANEDIIGSLEFGCKVSGAKLIVVMGHEYCGAIKSAIDKVKLGNITALLSKIAPAIDSVKNFQGDKTSKNPAFVEAVTKENVLNTIQVILKRSPILKEMVDKNEIKIVGAEYHMETGKVEFF